MNRSQEQAVVAGVPALASLRHCWHSPRAEKRVARVIGNSAVEAGDTAFFFYAGHGFEIARQNVLPPTTCR